MLQNAGAKILIFFYPTKRSYEISACNLTIRTKTAFFSLQFDYYAEDFAVAVDGVVAEHLAGGDVARLGALVGDELYKVGVACHKICVLLFIR